MGNNQTEKAFEEKRLAQTISLAGRQKKIRNYRSQKRCA